MTELINKALLLFPPNWSACVSGPHLAMPLLAGISKDMRWHVETLDLSDLFYRCYANSPSRTDILKAAQDYDFAELDRLYFDWEDQLRCIPLANAFGPDFGLLSGY